MRTDEEIKRQIEGIGRQVLNLPEYSFFGDNNWRHADAQIAILRGDAIVEDFEDENEYIKNGAQDAADWMEDESRDDLFEDDED